MDPSLWSQLPVDIQEEVLAWLPAKEFCRYRTVCQRWNSITSCPNFQTNYSSIEPQDTWLLMFTDPNYKSVFVYIPPQNEWFSLSLRFLPENIDNVTVAGALICFRLLESNGRSALCICNPLTGSWRRLPAMAGKWGGNMVGLVMDKSYSHYKVIVQTKHSVAQPGHGDNRGNRDHHGPGETLTVRTEEFDSRSNRWRVSSDCQANFTTGSAFCNGVLYFITWISNNGQFVCDGVHGYDVQQCRWVRIEAPLPFFYVCPHLVECQGKLLMVGGFGDESIGIRIWEFQPKSLTWAVLHTMPQHLIRHVLRKPGYRLFNCVGYKNLVYLGECNTANLFVVFNVNTMEWSSVETKPPPAYSSTFSWFQFTPRLNALV